MDNGRNTLFFDLRCDPDQIDLGDSENCFSGRDKPFRLCKDSEIPLTFTTGDWCKLGVELNFESDLGYEKVFEIEAKIDISAIIEKFNESKKTYEKSPYVEAQIYEDFHALDDEKWLMNDFHQADLDLKRHWPLALKMKGLAHSQNASSLIIIKTSYLLSV